MPKGSPKEPKTLECRHCQVQFVQTKVNQQYCGHSCTKKAAYLFKQTKRDYYQYDRNYALKRNYGIDEQEYQALFDKQKGLCAICNKTYSRLLDVDHCHTTGKIRGLLCRPCNMMLGKAYDNVDILQSAINYLKRN